MRIAPLLGLGLTSALTLAACGSDNTATPSDPAPVTDRDLDGLTTEQGDCDDLNDTVLPGASEIPGDGVDQDCDGEDTPVAAAEDVDQDGVTVAQGDCDDLDASIHPEARERTGDGVDSDCDGSERPALGEDVFAEVVGVIDTDTDGAISLDEFEAACAQAAMVLGEARPGAFMTHAVCAGTNACRGMTLQAWGELFEHDCRGVNVCSGWSCVETAVDQGRDGDTLFAEAGCLNCHTGNEGAFLIEVPVGEDVDAAVAAFFDKTDDEMRASIAFGIAGQSEAGNAYQNMPAHYDVMSRAEMDTVIAWIRTRTLEGASYDPADTYAPIKP
jgi:cytochrome c551/c552